MKPWSPARRATIAVTACGLFGGAVAPAAGAAVRHAAPGGNGTACTAAAPCAFDVAMLNGNSGDEVIVGPGDYFVVGGVAPSAVLDVHGASGQPRPRITFGAGSAGLSLYAGSRLADIEVTTLNTGSGATIWFSGDLIERVVARHPGSGSAIRLMENGTSTIRDAVAVASGSNGAAINVSGPLAVGDVQARLEQVTAIATHQNAYALYAASSAGRSSTVTLDRAILRSTVGGDDIYLNQSNAPLTVASTRSAFTGVSAIGSPLLIQTGTVRALPLLGGPEYHQLSGSPTIDAGGDVPFGPFDLDGDPRWLGPATDVGADEFRPAPVAPTASATALGARAVAIATTLDTGGLDGTWRVDYGPTAAYGQTTGERPLVAARGARQLTATLAGLAASTEIHYRVVLTTAGGVGQSADGVVTTGSPETVIVASPPVERVVERTVTVTRTVVAAPRVSGLSVARRAVSFQLDGAARVTVTVRKGRRTVRSIVRSLRAGRNTVRLPRLGSGRFTVTVQADASGTPVSGALRIR